MSEEHRTTFQQGDYIMSNTTIPAGYYVHIGRARLEHYEWFDGCNDPRSDYDHGSELAFPKGARRGMSDKDASLSWALDPVMKEIECKYTMFHKMSKEYRASKKLYDANINELAEVAPKYLAVALKYEVYENRLRQLRTWFDVPSHHTAPLAAIPDGVTDDDLVRVTGYTNREDPSAMVRWWVHEEYALVHDEYRELKVIVVKYQDLVRATKYHPVKPERMDDREFIEDLVGWGGDDFETFFALAEHFPEVLRKHVPVWATVEGDNNRTWYEIFGHNHDTQAGLWWVRRDLLVRDNPGLFTATGREKKGLFRRFVGGDKTSYEGHLKHIAHSELSEYVAWADNSAVEVVVEMLPFDATYRKVHALPGIIDDDDTVGIIEELFADNDAELDTTGPWYEVDDRFNATDMVMQAFPAAMFGDGTLYFPEGYNITDYLIKEWRFGYADDPGTYHFFGVLSKIPKGAQLDLPMP